MQLHIINADINIYILLLVFCSKKGHCHEPTDLCLTILMEIRSHLSQEREENQK